MTNNTDMTKCKHAYDAKDKKVRVEFCRAYSNGEVVYRALEPHHTKSGIIWDAGKKWYFMPDGTNHAGLRLIPPTEADEVPEWAMREICSRACISYGEYLSWPVSSDAGRALEAGGRLIAEHEEQPDPLRDAVEDALDFWDNHTFEDDPVGVVVGMLRKRGVQIGGEA